ncbi:MAG: putative Ig domain-containing protein [Candidatus Thermoplasmatota archaeon]|nr:putative Ig domain-containing protein [Candidatus Thermoplasmatota archaeon]
MDWILKEPPDILGLKGPGLISNISSGHFSIGIEYPERILDRLNVTALTKHSSSSEWTPDDVRNMAINESSGKWEFDIVPTSDTRIGNHSVMITLTDYWGDQVERTFLDQFIVYNVNDPPFIRGTPRKNCYEDILYEFQPEVNDLDPEDIHTWAMDTNAPFLTIDQSTGYLSGTPKNSDIGSFTVSLTVTDLGGLTDDMNFTLTVINVNDPPEILTEFPEGILEDAKFSLMLEALDIDPSDDLLMWNMRTNCSFLTLKRSEGMLEGTPLNKDVGPFYVVVNVSDGMGGYDERNFTSSVINTNDPPALGAPPSMIDLYEDSTYNVNSVPGWFTDVDGDQLEIQHSTPENLYLTLTDQMVLVIEPVPDWNGEETVTFLATDGEFNVECDVILRVLPVNDPPKDISISIEKTRFEVNERIVASGYANDVDTIYGDQLTYRWFKRGGSPLGGGSMLETYLEVGDHELVLNVTDQKGSGIETSVLIEVYEESSFLETYGTYLIIISVVFVLLILLLIALIIYRKMSRSEKELPPDEVTLKEVRETIGGAEGYSASLVGGGTLHASELGPIMKPSDELPPASQVPAGPANQLPPASPMFSGASDTSEYVRPTGDPAPVGYKAPPLPGMVSQPLQNLPPGEGEVYPARADMSSPPSVTSIIDQMITDAYQPPRPGPLADEEVYPKPDVEPQFNSPVWSPEAVEERVASEARSAVEILHELNQLRMEGAITEEEFQTHKKKLLRKI